jgi:hypothetical protein
MSFPAHAVGSSIKPAVELGPSPHDCWRWLGAFDPAGYPRKTVGGRTMTGQRWIFEQLFGKQPRDLVISTTCKNRGCVNPHHLVAQPLLSAQRLGSRSKLKPSQVIAIKRDLEAVPRMTFKALAAKHGVDRTTISDIRSGRTWDRKEGTAPWMVSKKSSDDSAGAPTGADL